MEAGGLLEQLIAIPSITGSEEKLGEFLAAQLERLGCAVMRQPVADGRFNLLASFGSPRVLLSTHLDTVPPYIPFREEAEYIFGRGACDAKGIIAAMVEAGGRLAREGTKGFGYLFTVGEEIDSAGAKTAAASGLRAEYLIVGEPTENKLAVGHKGSLAFRIKTKGRAGHSAYPERAESAIDKLLDILADLRRIDFGSDPLLGRATLNTGMISGGVRPNVVADRAEAALMLRLVGPAEAACEKIMAAVAGRAEVEIILSSDPQRMEKIEGLPTTVVSFGTDIPYLRPIGRPLLIGPGSILDAHTMEEKIAKRELREAVDIYCYLVKALLR